MRLKAALVAVIVLFLLLVGLRLDGLPFARQGGFFSDSAVAHWPAAMHLRESLLQDGKLPVWRETTMSGQPFAANPVNKTAYPFQWFVLLFAPALHLNIQIILHLFLALSGMWIWCRSLGLEALPAALSAIAFTLSPRLLAHLASGHLDIVFALAWWPWLMWTTRHFVDSQSSPWKSALLLAITASLLFTADVRVALFAFPSALVYLIIEARHQSVSIDRLAWLLLVLALSAVLVLALVLPYAIWEPYLNRSQLTPAEAGLMSLQPLSLLGLLMPSIFSRELLTYVGVSVFLLAGMGWWAVGPRWRALSLVVLILAFLFALGPDGPLWSLLTGIVPSLLAFRVPARSWFLIALFAPLLAGVGLHYSLSRVRVGTYAPRLVMVVFIVSVMVLGLVSVVFSWRGTFGWLQFIVALALLITFTVFWRGLLSARHLAVVLLMLTALDLVGTGHQLLVWRGPDYWLDPYRPMAERLKETRPDRIYSPAYTLEQQVAEAYGLHLFGGVDPFQLTGIVQAIEQGSGISSPAFSPVLPALVGVVSDEDITSANQGAVPDTEVLARWSVSHIVAPYMLQHARLSLLDRIGPNYIYQNLDYQPRQLPADVPDWPPDWPELPNAATVERLNQITSLAASISGVAWILSLGLLIVSTLRKSR